MVSKKNMSGIGGMVFWQAHRGGGGFERPDNTLLSALYGWNLGGIAELDIRLTADGQIVCLHDPTLRRTTFAPDDIADLPVTQLRYDQFAHLDAGSKFSPEYREARIPLLTEVFSVMAEDPARRAYLDCKNIDLGQLAKLISEYGLDGRLWVTGPKREDLVELKKLLPSADTMQWLGGSAADITAKFEASAASGFEGLGQIQIHLNDKTPSELEQKPGWRYTIEPDYLRSAMERCAASGIDFEVLTWKFEESDIHALLDLGVRWYATDEPARFQNVVKKWLASRGLA